jgi:hypothetical protein
MANPKRMKSWRRNSLSYTRDVTTRYDMAKQYKVWLCNARGWFTNTEVCKKCHGRGEVMPDHSGMTYSRHRTWKKNRTKAGLPTYLTEADLITCSNCKGEGKLPLHNSVPDLQLANEYVENQRYQLDRIACDAVEEIEVRLRDADFRPVPDRGANHITNLAAFDAWEAERSRLRRVFDDACETARAAREAADAAYEAMTDDEKCAYLNDGAEAPHKRLERLKWDAQAAMHKHGYTTSGYWWRPGERKYLFVGTQKPHRDLGASVVIVIKPGRSPDYYELDRITADALADLASMATPAEIDAIALPEQPVAEAA